MHGTPAGVGADAAAPAGAVLAANLAALPPATRAAVLDDAGPRAAGDGERLVLQTADGRWLPLVTGTRGAGVDAMAAKLEAAGTHTVLAIGLGLGHLLDAIERRGAAMRVVAIEPVPAVARALLARRDWTPWLTSGRLRLLVGPAYPGATEAWRWLDPAGPAPFVFVGPWVDRLCPELVPEATGLAGRIVSGASANAEARRQFAGRYLIHTLQNLPVIATEGDAAALTALGEGRPAVVVGAGPSLDRSLALVADLAERALVIAVDTALRPLLAAGVRPDLVVALDPSEVNARHLHAPGDVAGVWLVAEPSLHPSAFEAFRGRTFTFGVADHEPWPWLAARGCDRGRLQAWGSVLTTAFDLACVMGCAPIVFTGADLAYSRGLQYCRNTTYEPLWKDCPDDASRAALFRRYLDTHDHGPAPDVLGNDVLTAPHFLQFRDWIVARARTWVAGGAGRRVLNAGGEGILHGGPLEMAGPDQVAAVTASAPPWRPAAFATLAGAHRRSAAPASAASALGAALADPDGWPRQRWSAFAAGTHGAEDVDRAVDGARAALAGLERRAAALAAARAPWDAPASRADAERAIHPDYAFAVGQAASQIAFAIEEAGRRRPGGDAPARVLDVGCGLGRTMVPWRARGVAVDGVDSSATMLALAAADPALDGSRLFLSSGADCGEAPDGGYDLVTMFHAFHRVRPRAIRRALLAAMARALGPGGCVHIQLPYFPDLGPDSVPEAHVPWAYDDLDAECAGRRGEVWTTPADLPLVLADLGAVFVDVNVQIVDFPATLRRFGAGAPRLAHLLLSGSTAPGLARRIYALHRE
ncbi:MAG: 6-hydroxymethylpterin diphosphokinase MptE-like protein [Vicinamibacterales bacterium]